MSTTKSELANVDHFFSQNQENLEIMGLHYNQMISGTQDRDSLSVLLKEVATNLIYIRDDKPIDQEKLKFQRSIPKPVMKAMSIAYLAVLLKVLVEDLVAGTPVTGDLEIKIKHRQRLELLSRMGLSLMTYAGQDAAFQFMRTLSRFQLPKFATPSKELGTPQDVKSLITKLEGLSKKSFTDILKELKENYVNTNYAWVVVVLRGMYVFSDSNPPYNEGVVDDKVPVLDVPKSTCGYLNRLNHAEGLDQALRPDDNGNWPSYISDSMPLCKATDGKMSKRSKGKLKRVASSRLKSGYDVYDAQVLKILRDIHTTLLNSVGDDYKKMLFEEFRDRKYLNQFEQFGIHSYVCSLVENATCNEGKIVDPEQKQAYEDRMNENFLKIINQARSGTTVSYVNSRRQKRPEKEALMHRYTAPAAAPPAPEPSAASGAAAAPPAPEPAATPVAATPGAATSRVRSLVSNIVARIASGAVPNQNASATSGAAAAPPASGAVPNQNASATSGAAATPGAATSVAAQPSSSLADQLPSSLARMVTPPSTPRGSAPAATSVAAQPSSSLADQLPPSLATMVTPSSTPRGSVGLNSASAATSRAALPDLNTPSVDTSGATLASGYDSDNAGSSAKAPSSDRPSQNMARVRASRGRGGGKGRGGGRGGDRGGGIDPINPRQFVPRRSPRNQ